MNIWKWSALIVTGKKGFNSILVAGFLSGSFGFKREEGQLYSHAFFQEEKMARQKGYYTTPVNITNVPSSSLTNSF